MLTIKTAYGKVPAQDVTDVTIIRRAVRTKRGVSSAYDIELKTNERRYSLCGWGAFTKSLATLYEREINGVIDALSSDEVKPCSPKMLTRNGFLLEE